MHSLHIIDILDVRELNFAYLARTDCKSRTAWTGNQKTQVSYLEELPTIEQVWKARKCPVSLSRGNEMQQRAIADLKSTLNMAVDDACDPGWLRTREQVDGGLFAPKRKLKTWEETRNYLLDFELLMNASIPKALRESFIRVRKILNNEAVDDYHTAQNAKKHNY